MAASEVIYQLRREVCQKDLLIEKLKKQNQELVRQLDEAGLQLIQSGISGYLYSGD